MASDTVRGVSWVQMRGLVMWIRTLLLLTSMAVGREKLLGAIAASQGANLDGAVAVPSDAASDWLLAFTAYG